MGLFDLYQQANNNVSGLMGGLTPSQSDYLNGLAMGLLSQSGWSRTPVTFGQAMGNAMGTAQQYQSEQQLGQMRNAQLQGMQLENQRRADEAKARTELGGMLGTAPTVEQMGPPTSGGIFGTQITNPGTGLLGGQIDPATFYAKAATLPGYEQLGFSGLAGISKKKEPFTLSENQVRFDENGKPIAVGPPKMEGMYTNVSTDDAGQAWGVNRQTGVYERVPQNGKPTITSKQDAKGFSNAKDLRDEFTKQSKEFTAIRDAYGRVIEGAKNPSAAGDLSLIFSYMKILDPTSVVRESEQASAANAAGVPDQIRNMYNRVLSGERLNPVQRADFLSRAQMLYQRGMENQASLENQYSSLAQRYGISPQDVIVNYRLKDNAPALPTNAKQAPDGNFYIPDPKRPGKYLRVDQ